MKTSRIITVVALLGMATFTSCKKDYVCTCTTVVSAASVTVTHDIDNSNYADAKKNCNTYRDEANKTLPGSTDCRL